MRAPNLRALLDRGAPLPVRRQCVLLGVARPAVSRAPRPASDDDFLLVPRM
jgi:putative transposase